MLKLKPEQWQWVSAQERERLATALSQALTQHWPALATRLGTRNAAFVDTALQHAQRHGLNLPHHAARLLNLWCLWGPAFDDKPGFEWAAAILADPRRTPAVKVQQLVLQSRDLLAQPGAAIAPETLDQTDAALVAATAQPQASAWIAPPPEASDEPKVACDLATFDLGLADQPWRQTYRLSLVAGAPVASLVPLSVPPQRYRVDQPLPPGQPSLPRQIAALACPVSAGPKAMLLVHCGPVSVCHEHTHPRVELKSLHGGTVLQGQLARLVKWPLYRADDPPPPGPFVPSAPPTSAPPSPGSPVSTITAGGGIARQRPPSHVALSVHTCGLRRTGAPLGEQQALVTVYPAEQWLAEFKTQPQPEWQWPASGERPASYPAQVKLWCDAQPQASDDWTAGWQRMGPALADGLQAWWEGLQRSGVLLGPQVHIVPGLMHGHSLWTWGAQEALHAEGSTGFWRAQAEGGFMACDTQLNLSGELAIEGTRSRLRLKAQGATRLDTRLLHEQAEPPLASALAQLKVSWRYPFSAELDALSQPGLATLALDPHSALGALSGEAGLRPRPDGQGWQWFCTLHLEPATLTLHGNDPLRGTHRRQVALWPATPLMDWSVG